MGLQTLPYIELSNGYNLPSDGDPNMLGRNQRTGAEQLIREPLGIINCPSRRAARPYPNDLGARTPLNHNFPDEGGKLDYAANCGDQNSAACSAGPPGAPWDNVQRWTGWDAELYRAIQPRWRDPDFWRRAATQRSYRRSRLHGN